ncbi:hypothetical protein AMTR_s00043p00232340 [Amborella trichopoda]|uniref:NADAR domain-containing protein n=1 Tax=Amborella trichopoda TaxID=13333 RepID=W1PXR8_AMBTC|nr:hypothetical protein AMTR_s00043p00232340 [Amborella trichopoda]
MERLHQAVAMHHGLAVSSPGNEYLNYEAEVMLSLSVAIHCDAKRGSQEFPEITRIGVEVVEFDILNPRDVMEYCYDRGYLSILWECGGGLAAPTIASGVIHKVCAFVCPKIIGGLKAPTPVGELGMVKMSQALNLTDVSFEQVILVIGPDMLISGFLQPIPDLTPVIPSLDDTSSIDPTLNPYDSNIIFFYKTWDPYGAFSNFSSHPLHMPDENGVYITWQSVEHYYQANKFVGVDYPIARACVGEIKSTGSPEEAARIGRISERHTLICYLTSPQPPDGNRRWLGVNNLISLSFLRQMRADWDTLKINVMYRALKCKFSTYPHLKSLLLSTVGSVLVEASPHDLFWGGGREGEGLNYLGCLLMQIRSEFLGEDPPPINC